MTYQPVDIVGLLDWSAVATLDDGMAAGFRSASSEVADWRDALVAELGRWSDYYSETFGMSEKPMRDAKAEAYRHAARLIRGEP